MKSTTIELSRPSVFPERSDACESPNLALLGLDQAEVPTADPHARAIAGWVRGYLMRPHPELGRPGHVCPFTAQAARLSLVRIGVSPHGGGDQTGILATMNEALRAFDAMPCKRSTRVFRTVIVAFPGCAERRESRR